MTEKPKTEKQPELPKQPSEKEQTQTLQVPVESAIQSIPAAALKASLHNDWSGVTEPDRLKYVGAICKALNIPTPLNPFRFIKMNGKEVLYAGAPASQLIADRNELSIPVLKMYTEKETQIRCVEVRATSKNGRHTDEMGSVYVGGLKGQDLANAYMKTITKAKRRAVFSHCGLSVSDDDDLDAMRKQESAAGYAPNFAAVAEAVVPTIMTPAPVDQEIAQYKAQLFKKLCGKTGKFPNDPATADAWIEETTGMNFKSLNAQDAVDLLAIIDEESAEDPVTPDTALKAQKAGDSLEDLKNQPEQEF